MDGECAFCGRGDGAARQIFCDDCQTEHKACTRCAEEVANEVEGYRLVA